MGTVGCVPRMHRLIGMIGDHALQNRNRTKCVCIMAASNNVIPAKAGIQKLLKSLDSRRSLPRT